MKHDWSLATLRCKSCHMTAIGIDRDMECRGSPPPEPSLPEIPMVYKWWPTPVEKPDAKPFNLGEEVSFKRLQAATRGMKISCN